MYVSLCTSVHQCVSYERKRAKNVLPFLCSVLYKRKNKCKIETKRDVSQYNLSILKIKWIFLFSVFYLFKTNIKKNEKVEICRNIYLYSNEFIIKFISFREIGYENYTPISSNKE